MSTHREDYQEGWLDDDIVCPHCKAIQGTYEGQMDDEESWVWMCELCGKEFTVHTEMVIQYATFKEE